MKICDKCKTPLEPNKDKMANYQSIRLYDKKYDLCNNCSDEVLSLINPGAQEEEVFVDSEKD